MKKAKFLHVHMHTHRLDIKPRSQTLLRTKAPVLTNCLPNLGWGALSPTVKGVLCWTVFGICEVMGPRVEGEDVCAENSPGSCTRQSQTSAAAERAAGSFCKGGWGHLSSFRFVSVIVYNLSAGPRWALRGQGARRKCWSLSSLT